MKKSSMQAGRVVAGEILGSGDGRSKARQKPAKPALPQLSAHHLQLSKSEERRNAKILKIIKCALQVLAREGYAQFSMRAVAAEAGLGLSTLQHYFESRDKLLFEAVRVFISGYGDRYNAWADDQNLTPDNALIMVLQDIADAVTRPEVCGIYFEIWALGRHDPAVGDLIVTLYDEYRALFAKLLRNMDIGLSQLEADELAYLMAAQSEGLVVLGYHGGLRHPMSSSLMARIKSMWPALARLPLTENAPDGASASWDQV